MRPREAAALLLGLGAAIATLLCMIEPPEPNPCAMTYMHPIYSPINISELGIANPRHYSLLHYSDSRVRLRGTPLALMLFIPGHAGDAKQVRSLGSELLLAASRRNASVAVYAVDFNSEATGLDGALVLAQQAFTEAVARALLGRHGADARLVLAAHSMGGLAGAHVAGALGPEYIRSLLLLASPLEAPPLAVDAIMQAVYARLHAAPVAHALAFAGGPADRLIASHLVASAVAPTLWLPAMPGVWRSADHRCVLWCGEFVRALAAPLARGLSPAGWAAGDALVAGLVEALDARAARALGAADARGCVALAAAADGAWGRSQVALNRDAPCALVRAPPCAHVLVHSTHCTAQPLASDSDGDSGAGASLGRWALLRTPFALFADAPSGADVALLRVDCTANARAGGASVRVELIAGVCGDPPVALPASLGLGGEASVVVVAAAQQASLRLSGAPRGCVLQLQLFCADGSAAAWLGVAVPGTGEAGWVAGAEGAWVALPLFLPATGSDAGERRVLWLCNEAAGEGAQARVHVRVALGASLAHAVRLHATRLPVLAAACAATSAVHRMAVVVAAAAALAAPVGWWRLAPHADAWALALCAGAALAARACLLFALALACALVRGASSLRLALAVAMALWAAAAVVAAGNGALASGPLAAMAVLAAAARRSHALPRREAATLLICLAPLLLAAAAVLHSASAGAAADASAVVAAALIACVSLRGEPVRGEDRMPPVAGSALALVCAFLPFYLLPWAGVLAALGALRRVRRRLL